ncbi:hypothetical protein E3N88_28816 [Mikania micrantha]|uniref:Uncharacterized protein n=1 Tax=Mikania micrantha TaxID=192012 RepID=A0A5N6N3C5_9ASTR|nr:hypothetical protein E3N88_28816 [Mikania micrantha]
MEFESKLNSSKLEKKNSHQSQLRPDSKPFIPSTLYPSTVSGTKLDSKTNLRLTYAEKQARFLKGECFKCGAKYGPGHRCQTGTLKLLATDDDESEDVEEEPKDQSEETVEISLNAILGRPHPTTMKVHDTLKNTERITTTEQQRLLLKLMPYDFSITHRAWKENRGADALSRRLMCATLLTLIVPYCVDVEDIREGLETDLFTLDLIHKLQNSFIPLPDFALVDGFLFYRKRLVIRDVPGLCLKLLHEAHDSPTGGHGGFIKTLGRLSSQYFLPHMNKDIHRDVVFLSHFWQELFRLSQTKLKLSSSYHPQTDGQSKVLNRCLESYLRCFAQEQPRKWSFFLPWAEHSYNTGFHSAMGTTFFSAVYGRPPPPLIPYVVGETNNAELEQQLLDRDDMLKLLRENLMKAQDRMRNQANTKRRDVSFAIGDYVFGPYQIKRVIGPVAYELGLPPTARIHPVFHVSLLKPARGVLPSNPPVPLPINKDYELELSPFEILQHRWVIEAGHPVLELLVSWCNFLVEEATWESSNGPSGSALSGNSGDHGAVSTRFVGTVN